MKIVTDDYSYKVKRTGTKDDGNPWMIFQITVDKRKFEAFKNEDNEELITKAEAGEPIEFYAIVKHRLWMKSGNEHIIIPEYKIVSEDNPLVAVDRRLDELEAQVEDMAELQERIEKLEEV